MRLYLSSLLSNLHPPCLHPNIFFSSLCYFSHPPPAPLPLYPSIPLFLSDTAIPSLHTIWCDSQEYRLSTFAYPAVLGNCICTWMGNREGKWSRWSTSTGTRVDRERGWGVRQWWGDGSYLYLFSEQGGSGMGGGWAFWRLGGLNDGV
jgi:hypothetical protein